MSMAGSGLPSNIYYTEFTPESNTKSITVDVPLTGVDQNQSIVIGIITSDVVYGEIPPIDRSIVQCVIYLNKAITFYFRAYAVRSNGTNDYYSASVCKIENGQLVITSQIAEFVGGCKYRVVVMV